MILNLIFSIFLFFTFNSSQASEVISGFENKNIPVLNDELNSLNSNVNKANTTVAALTAYFTNERLNTLYGGTSADLSACVQGSVPYFNATGVMACLAPDTEGKVFTTHSTGANPTFVTPVTPGLLLVSTTPVSGASTSGDISLTNGNTYYIQYNLYDFGGGADRKLQLQFNADSGSHYVYTGTTASSSILITLDNIEQSATEGVNGSFYIQEAGSSSQIYHMWGNGIYRDADAANAITSINTIGRWSNSANITSFVLSTLGAQNMTGIIYLYKVATS